MHFQHSEHRVTVGGVQLEESGMPFQGTCSSSRASRAADRDSVVAGGHHTAHGHSRVSPAGLKDTVLHVFPWLQRTNRSSIVSYPIDPDRVHRTWNVAVPGAVPFFRIRTCPHQQPQRPGLHVPTTLLPPICTRQSSRFPRDPGDAMPRREVVESSALSQPMEFLLAMRMLFVGDNSIIMANDCT